MKAFGGDVVCDCAFLAQRGMLEEVRLETSPANFSGLPDETDENKLSAAAGGIWTHQQTVLFNCFN